MLQRWTLSEGWTELARESDGVQGDRNSSATAREKAWQQLAMLYGDTGAPELCVVVAQAAIERAAAGAAADSDPNRLAMPRSHAKLSLLDLGLGSTDNPGGPFLIREIAERIEGDEGEIRNWLRSFLAPVGGLEPGARFRAGRATRPDPLTIEAVMAK